MCLAVLIGVLGVAVIAGDGKRAEARAAGFPGARLLVLSPAGHFPYIEQKAATLSAINTFLDGG